VGHDGTHPKMFRELAAVTMRHLSILIRRLWSSGVAVWMSGELDG